ncbi:MAG: LbtU family siderophore porin [Deltaproteobacteria bacterium]|nr:LbtU family siderophore porin [Deltaproteobacteria bacterium]
MNKGLMSTFLTFIVISLMMPGVCICQEMSNTELMQELKALKEKIRILEEKLEKQEKVSKEKISKDVPTGLEGQGLPERVRRIEEKMAQKQEGILEKWADKITLSGVIEAEAGYEDYDYDNPATNDEDSSDITLATVELGVDVDITKHVKGHVLFLWEEDDTEPVDVDEGFITLDGADVVPLYLNVGKLYVPFGNFESHFISDPLTLELGETRESALSVGYVNEWMDVSVSAFNGDIDETGEDNHIESYVAAASFSLPQELISNFGIAGGVSYISNIADSDGLEGETPGQIKDYVGGFNAFLSISFIDKFFLECEYLGALDEFKANELSFDGGKEFQPETWNFELAYAATDRLEIAVKYEGGDDLGGPLLTEDQFLPEDQYGVAVTYGLFESTSLSLEYLHGEFENDDERDLVTTQLAVEF